MILACFALRINPENATAVMHILILTFTFYCDLFKLRLQLNRELNYALTQLKPSKMTQATRRYLTVCQDIIIYTAVTVFMYNPVTITLLKCLYVLLLGSDDLEHSA